MYKLDGKKAVVTGAASGLGRSLALVLAPGGGQRGGKEQARYRPPVFRQGLLDGETALTLPVLRPAVLPEQDGMGQVAVHVDGAPRHAVSPVWLMM